MLEIITHEASIRTDVVNKRYQADDGSLDDDKSADVSAPWPNLDSLSILSLGPPQVTDLRRALRAI